MPPYTGQCLHIGGVLDEGTVLVMPLYCIMGYYSIKILKYSETSIHRFHRGLKKKRWIRENELSGNDR
jgi:hypothetical protein